VEQAVIRAHQQQQQVAQLQAALAEFFMEIKVEILLVAQTVRIQRKVAEAARAQQEVACLLAEGTEKLPVGRAEMD
jgi:hypothetical protein